MGLRIISPGPCVTVQDGGRRGFREWGVAPGGAFDRRSFDLANALLGNSPDAAALELTLFGGTFEATATLAIALAGAPMEASVEPPGAESCVLRIPQSLTLQKGSRLILSGAPLGARTYLAVRGGWQTPSLLGSRSREERLRSGDVVSAEEATTPVRRLLDGRLDPPNERPIRIVAGPDARRLIDPESLERAHFCVGPQSDRVGLRIDGQPVKAAPEPERVSTPVCCGAIQVAGERLIVLGVACGTMGGYAHVAQVISADLDRLGQLRPGDSVPFERIGLAEARRLDQAERLQWRERLARVKAMTEP